MTILWSFKNNRPFQKKIPSPSTFLVLHSCCVPLLLLDTYGHRTLRLPIQRSRTAPLLLIIALPFSCSLYCIVPTLLCRISSPPSLFWFLHLCLFLINGISFSLSSCLSTCQMSDLTLTRHWTALLLVTLISNSECSPEKQYFRLSNSHL